ncbi:MAG: polymer-forming cytoskeletal protein [Cytophagales bacterium]|nr:polymer-forming cytoskeletal protein [Cytophagales bacterium]
MALGHSSHVEGNIIAQNADIEGEVKGKLEVSELLILKATAKIHGDIITGKLVVEPGAAFNGSCKMGAVIKEIKIGESNGMHALRPKKPAPINLGYR